ncbi:ankyrin repeat-containing protein [Legionella quinlivanii]|uniref:Ankyrin repeat-containing protein n=1 Tax=Legionella quinlivanii TaxID=45073 RepID=A0A0W0XKY1_9GAMM|nr:hypothetical protein [Legionella quinlivanii]KTD45215.1 ankyrin repeat-containing protein [Legionella quinlivanii]SEG04905.1 hypothetical protein SAMN02746093_01740 [Legionella quinlivanii DSM 21216]STY11485.1 ankyrin repeat-containing protein [Legionella quinlivanii]
MVAGTQLNIPKRNQANVIKNLNKYLESQNLPVRMPIDGICRGLAVLRCKYILENRESEYFSIIDKIANLEKLDKGSINEVNHFVVETLVAFSPHLFDSTKEQRHSLSNLSINGHPLKPSLKMSLIATDEKWVSVLQDISLKPGEGMLLTLTNHAVSVSRLENGQYRLADPNDPEGYIHCADEKSLIVGVREIARKCGWKGDLGLDLEVVRHPIAEIRTPALPSSAELFARYLDVNASCTRQDNELKKEEKFSQLIFACRKNNARAVELICEKSNPGSTDMLKGLTYAVMSNNKKVIDYMLESGNQELISLVKRPEISRLLFDFALMRGKYGSFKCLIQNDVTQNNYLNLIVSEQNATQYLNQAAAGGSPEILSDLLNDYRQKSHPFLSEQQIADHILNKYKDRDAIEAAIGEKGNCGISNTKSVSLLLDQLKKAGRFPDDEMLLHYTLLAVKTNQPHMVKLLCDTASHTLARESRERLFKSIYLGVETARETDYSVLKTLEDAGAHFSFGVRGIMKEKRGQAPGILLSIGIQLSKFSDWLDGITKINNVSYCKERLKTFKQSIKGDEASPVNPVSVFSGA